MEYQGVMCVFWVSLCCGPFAFYFLAESGSGSHLHMYMGFYSLLLTSLIVFLFFLPPDVDFWNFERRGVFYYTCCLLACVNIIELATHYCRVVAHPRSKYFARDEIYLKTPFGMSSVLWNNVANYTMYLMMIFGIDNYASIRNIAMYWSGAMITSELVIGVALLSGTSSNKIQFSSMADICYVTVWAVVIIYYLVFHPRSMREKISVKKGWIDVMIFLLLLFSIAFNFVRIMGALNSSQYYIKLYRTLYEPYMLHPSKYGCIWVLVSGAFGIPCEILAIYHLYKCEFEKALNIALLYAGCMLQGTVVYLSYNMFSNSDKAYRFSKPRIHFVCLYNSLLVVGAHLFLARCLWVLPVECTTYDNCVHVKNKDYCSSTDFEKTKNLCKEFKDVGDFTKRPLSKYDFCVPKQRFVSNSSNHRENDNCVLRNLLCK